jgi:MOSC domain-containing protein YiiM
MCYYRPMEIIRLYRSNAHVYVGHFGRPAGTTPMEDLSRLRIVADRGIEGDRYFGKDPGHKGQVSFFAEEAWLRLCSQFGRADIGPDVFRRNVIVRGADLLGLIGAEFEVQGVRFQGSEYCKPCFWMDQAFAPGAFAALTAWKAGGLRARALSDGWLEVSDRALRSA